MKWNDEQLDGKGYVNWYPFQHPQLGAVEIGGWHHEKYFGNPPPQLLEKEIAPHADFIIFHALLSPLLQFQEITVTPLGNDTHHIRALVQNTGWLPTNVTARAVEKNWCVRSNLP